MTEQTQAVTAAASAVTKAERFAADLEEQVRNGDTTIGEADLMAADAAVRLARLRHEAAQRAEQKSSQHADEMAQRRYLARRQAQAASDEHDRLASELRAIESGAAAKAAASLRGHGQPTFPTTVDEFYAQHPTFQPDTAA